MQSGRIVSLDRADFELWRSGAGESSKIIDKRLLRRVITERLTPIQRDYLSDYYFNGMTMREIAATRGVAVSTVSRTISRAKVRIREALKYTVRS